MKKIFILMFMFVFSSLCVAMENESNDKIYIDPSQILIGQNGIFINMNDSIVLVNMIAHDEQGVYSYTSAIGKLNNIQAWCCRRCQHHNVCWFSSCRQCGLKAPNWRED